MAILTCMSETTDTLDYGHISINGDWFHIMICPWGYQIPNGILKLEWANGGEIRFSETYDNIDENTVIFVTFTVSGVRVTKNPEIDVKRGVGAEQIAKTSSLVGMVAYMLENSYKGALDIVDEVIGRMRGSAPDAKLEMVKEAGKRRIYLVDKRCEDAAAIARDFFKSDNIMKILSGQNVVYSTAKPNLRNTSSSSQSTSSSNSQKSGGCYVATCVYGSYDCPEVWTLRRYRDDKLGSTWYGRMFIHTYYAISPTLVKWFGRTKWFKKLFKKRLDKMVEKLQCEGFEDTPYQDKMW